MLNTPLGSTGHADAAHKSLQNSVPHEEERSASLSRSCLTPRKDSCYAVNLEMNELQS